MARGIIRLDKVQSGTVGNIESVVHNAELQNGMVVSLGELVDGERELHAVKVPTDLEKDEILIHATPEVMYSSLEAGLKDFYVKQGKAARAYHLTEGDVVTVTDDMIEGETVKGEYLIPLAGQLKLQASATDQDGETTPRFAAKVIEKTQLGFEGTPATAFKVVRV